MRKAYPFSGGMSNVRNAVNMPDNMCELIENMYLDDDGVWKTFNDANATSLNLFNTGGKVASKVFQWFPAYLPTGTIDETFIYIVFYGTGTTGTVYYVHKTAMSGTTHTQVNLGLTGIDISEVYAWSDSNQFVFIDGRNGKPSQRIRINNEGTVTISNLSPDSSYSFPILTNLQYSEYDEEGTRDPMGAIYGWRAVFVNEFGEYSQPTQLLMVDLYQWQARGTIDGEGNYLYDDQLRGSLKSATIRVPDIPVGTVEVQLFRCNADGSESRQAMTGMFRTATKTISKTTTQTDIVDSYPFSPAALDIQNSGSPAGDDIALLSGAVFIANAVNTIDFPGDLASAGSVVHKITLSNPNEFNYVNRWFMIDLFDKKVNKGGEAIDFLDDFYWEIYRACTFTGVEWVDEGVEPEKYTHVSGTNKLQCSDSDITPVAGKKYNVTYTLTLTGHGTIVIAYGGDNALPVTAGAQAYQVVATSTESFTVTPSNDFTGSIEAITIIADEDILYDSTKCRILADDFITPLEVALYPVDRDIRSSALTTHTRRYAFVEIPYVMASGDTNIYFVQSLTALPTSPAYPNAFTELTTNGLIQDFYNALTANPVKSENSIICCSSKQITNSTWLSGNYQRMNKANKNYSQGYSTSVTISNTDFYAYDEMLQRYGLELIEDTNYETGTLLEAWGNSTVFMQKKGYFSVFLKAFESGDGSVDIIRVGEFKSEDGLAISGYRFEVRLTLTESGNDYIIGMSGAVDIILAGDVVSTTLISVTGHTYAYHADGVNKVGNIFALCSWESIPNVSTPAEPTLNISLQTICFDTVADSIVITRTTATGSVNGMVVDGTSPFTVYNNHTSRAMTSHFMLQFGDYILSTSENVRQLARWMPFFPVGFIGIDYTTTGDYYDNANVAITKITTASEKNPGRLWWSGYTDSGITEDNLNEEILRIVPTQSFQPTDEHNTILMWTGKDYWALPLFNDGSNGKPVKIGEGLGLTNRASLSLCYGGIIWQNTKGIHYLTSKGYSPIGVGYIDTSATTYLFYSDAKYKRVWAVEYSLNTASLAKVFVYDIQHKVWSKFLHATLLVAGWFGVGTAHYFLDGNTTTGTNKLYALTNATALTSKIYTKAFNIGRRNKIKRMTLLSTLFTGTFTYLLKLFGALTYGTQATLSTDLTGANNDLVFTANAYGDIGESVNVKYVNPGGTSALSLDVDGYNISVLLGVSTGTITTTAAQIKTLIEATPSAASLVSVAIKAGSDIGQGLVTEMAQAYLSGANPTGSGKTSATYTAYHNKPHSPVNAKSDYVQFQVTGANQVSGIEIEVK